MTVGVSNGYHLRPDEINSVLQHFRTPTITVVIDRPHPPLPSSPNRMRPQIRRTRGEDVAGGDEEAATVFEASNGPHSNPRGGAKPPT